MTCVSGCPKHGNTLVADGPMHFKCTKCNFGTKPTHAH